MQRSLADFLFVVLHFLFIQNVLNCLLRLRGGTEISQIQANKHDSDMLEVNGFFSNNHLQPSACAAA